MIKNLLSRGACGPLQLTLHAPCPRVALTDEWLASLSFAHDVVLRSHGSTCHAVTILPNAIHAVWSLPPATVPPAARLLSLETAFVNALSTSLPESGMIKCRKGINLKSRRIRLEADLGKHIDDCHFAPVRYGWVSYPEQWPHSTLRSIAPSEMILT